MSDSIQYIICLRFKIMKDTDTRVTITPPQAYALPHMHLHIISLGSALQHLMIQVSAVRAWQQQICIGVTKKNCKEIIRWWESLCLQVCNLQYTCIEQDNLYLIPTKHVQMLNKASVYE